MSRPLIVLTNDDGILAPGLGAMASALAELGEVVTVAPEVEQSGVSHGISVTRPLRINRLSSQRFAVNGTPADAVIAALLAVCDRPPALVVSGINRGGNLATDVLYSGTVAAAREAALRQIPALAVSQVLPDDQAAQELGDCGGYLPQCAKFAAALAAFMLAHPLPRETLINLNAPATATAAYCWTTLAADVRREQLLKRMGPRGAPYYWIASAPTKENSAVGTDCWAIAQGRFSLTLLAANHAALALANKREWQLDGYQLCEQAE